jgi:phosphopantothenoylcysteine decarboxylase/phosphopantothenate--cysteine ligase
MSGTGTGAPGVGSPLEGRRIVLGVTGGIAAYKAVEVCRRLVDSGAYVIPVLTDDATRFVGEVTFSALASEPVKRSLWSDADPIPHTRLGQTADLIVVAPATARFLGCYAAGISDGLLTATVLATRAPVIVCPAMHTEMWEHPAVQANLATLAGRGVVVVPPAEGRLAGGDAGTGRLAEPADIVAAVTAVLEGRPAVAPRRIADLAGRRVVVSAGGTREPIDPVRFITNRSSGKQGHALARAAADRGADVVLVTTTTQDGPPGATVVRVDTAASMELAMLEQAASADVVIMAAAVADFRPKAPSDIKLSRADGLPEIVLEPTPDILLELGARRRPGQILVGFAAETGSLHRAEAKLVAKGVDLLVANDVSAPGVGFDHDTNAVTVLGRDGSRREVALSAKAQVADAVLDCVVALWGEASGQLG